MLEDFSKLTMHMIKGVTSLNTRKPKFKLTKKKQAEWEFDWQADNKARKAQGMPKITFEEYCDNRLGKIKLPQPKFKTLVPSNSFAHLDEYRKKYPSLSNNVAGNTARKESPVYSGERKLLGIATMHKSNMVPVFSSEEATEISRMRRG